MEKEEVMVTVIDSIMGSGKSTYAIKMMQESCKKFLYVTPLISETERVSSAVTGMVNITKDMCKEKSQTKKEVLKELLEFGSNVAITHSLFESMPEDMVSIIKDKGYVLVIDETVNCMSTIRLSSVDVKLLYENCAIKEEECENGAYRLEWVDGNDLEDSYMLKSKSLFQSHKEIYKGKDNNILAWSLPPLIYKCLSEVYVLTYNFEGCDMSCYLKFHNIPYSTMTLHRGELIDLVAPIDGSGFKNLINVERHQGINSIGASVGGNSKPLSKSWYTHRNPVIAKKRAKAVKDCTYNFFNNIHKSPSKQNLVTVFCDDEIYDEVARQRGKVHVEREYKTKYNIKTDVLRAPFKTVGKIPSHLDKGSEEWKRKQCFVACNTRATNLYSDRTHCAFLIDVYLPPSVNLFLNQFDIEVDEELYALNTLVQWLWRSAVRNHQEINVYIPSKRMRRLLLLWLGYTEEELF